MTAALTFSGGNGTDRRTDDKALSNMDKVAEDGGMEADAAVIDCNAGPTVTADGDSATAADPMALPEPWPPVAGYLPVLKARFCFARAGLLAFSGS